ncbi:MAG TPA: cupin domain-containing protein [Gemmatimonadales bacterium]|nr:cupin domain-containing protein [Gemmatimonadales bacterium]
MLVRVCVRVVVLGVVVRPPVPADPCKEEASVFRMQRRSPAAGALIPLVAALVGATALAAPRHPVSVVVQLDGAASGYTPVLTGPPATVTMRSGYVVLGPGRSVGRHSTERYEEAIVVLEGTGRLTVRGGPDLALRGGSVAYSPPNTVHDVTNTGSTPLRYVYVVAKARR